jgi:predicted permease
MISRVELREAWRAIWRRPTVTISAVLCLALGLGVTTAIASALDRALLQPLPFRAPQELVTVYRTTPHFDTGPASAPNYRDLAAQTRQLSQLAAVGFTQALLSLPEEAVQVSAYRVTGNFFPMLGTAAQRGRLLTAADDAPGEAPVVVLSDEFWRARLGADPGIVGRTLRLDGHEATVVGILPPRFRVPHGAAMLRSDLWLPMRFTQRELDARYNNYLRTMGRLAPGATVASAEQELRRLFDGLTGIYPDLKGQSLRVLPLQTEGARVVRGPLLLLFGAVCLVLLIAATNVASLLLARGVERRREMAIRVALGARRLEVMRPVLVESLLLSGIGLGLGLCLAWAGVRTIGSVGATYVPQIAGLSLDLRMVGFAVGLTLLVALLCGAVPAWRCAAVDPQQALRAGAGGAPTHHRPLRFLVALEVALSLMLLLGAGLVLKGFLGLVGRDPGFDPRPVLTLAVTVSPEAYQDGSAPARFLAPALENIRAVPGVVAAGGISLLPYGDWGSNFNIRYEGQPESDPTTQPLVESRSATPDFFNVTGQRLLAGRLLEQTDADSEAPAVVVVNQALVRRDFPGQEQNVVGKRFYLGRSSFATIVGVVSDVRNFGPANDPRPEVYWSYRQGSDFGSSFPIMVRAARGDPAALVQPVLAAIHAVDPGAAVGRVMPMPELIARSVGRPRFYLILLSVFAGVALFLALAGLYGVLSYSVAQRSRELGIRTALGSSPVATIRLVTGQGMALVGAGLGAGLVGAVALTRVLQSLLYGVSPLDPVTWLLATTLLAAAGLVAALGPARRATQVDPLVAMRAD